jgi:hypothetical protein
MDRTLFRVLVILAVASVLFLAAISITVFMEIAFRATLSSTYEYEVSITSDAALENATFYIPVPARGPEASPVLRGIGSANLLGVPRGWNISLIGTEKFTMLEVTAREIPPTPPGRPYLLSLDAQTHGPIDTRTTGTGDLVLVPAAIRTPVACGNMDAGTSPEARCELYRASAYADFTAPERSHLSLSIILTGRNTWNVFGPASNEYQDGLQVSFSGGTRGWHTGDGILVTGIGDYGIDFRGQDPATKEAGSGGSGQGTGLSLHVGEGRE